MSSSYVDGKVREAIMAAKGSRTNAQKLLMAWAAADPELLRGIAQPFLKAIAAAAIERAARPASQGAASRSRAGGAAGDGNRVSASGLSRDALESLLDRLGRDDAPTGADPAVAANPSGPQPGGGGRSAAPPTGGGVGHEKAMMAIAKAFVAKKVR